MNKTRRLALLKIVKQLGAIEIGNLEDLKSDLESLKDEEQEYLDNMPGSMQNGDKGERASSAITALENAIEKIELLIDAAEGIEEATSSIEEACDA